MFVTLRKRRDLKQVIEGDHASRTVHGYGIPETASDRGIKACSSGGH